MKKMVQLSAAILSFSALTGIAQAATPGSYVGLGLGTSSLNTPNQQLFQSSAKHEIGGLGGRIFTGYNFNEYFGLETGYAGYAKSLYKGYSHGKTSSIEYSMSALDLVGKAYLPIGANEFNVYGLGGLAYVNNTVKYKNNGAALRAGDVAPAVGSHTNHKLRPIVGLGVSYAIPQTQFTTNLEFSHIQGSGNIKTNAKAIPSANLMTLNLSYNFG